MMKSEGDSADFPSKSEAAGNLMMVTLGMSKNNQITMTMLMNGRILGHIFLDKAAAENICAGLATHISYLKEEKLDA